MIPIQRSPQFLFKTLILFLFMGGFLYPLKAQTNVDYLINSALVFDGTETDPQQKDVGISGERIVFIGDAQKNKVKGKQTIDGEGLYLSPGFIDPHTHNGKWLDSEKASERVNIPSLSQGVTTVFIGSDGGGTFKIAEELNRYDREKIGTNVALLVGLGPVRQEVLGDEDIKPSSQQLEAMKALVGQAMKEGAFGLSTGLYYAPQVYASTEEVIEVSKAAHAYGGVYDTHMRSESTALLEAVDETIRIGEESGIPLMISHIKALGPAAWGRSVQVIEKVKEAQERGISIIANQYTYNASQTSIKAMVIPPWAQSGGNEEMVRRLKNKDTLAVMKPGISKNLAIRGGDSRIMISRTNDSTLLGRTLHDIASEWGVSPEDAAVKIISDYPVTSGASFSMDDDDIVRFMKEPWVVTGSDGGGGHPRTFGTFARLFYKYVKQDGVLTMKEAIRRSTGKTATFLGIKDRGFIKEGYYADVVLFDPDNIKDEADFQNPDRIAKGIKYVFVNGTLGIKDGNSTGNLSGKALRFKAEKQ